MARKLCSLFSWKRTFLVLAACLLGLQQARAADGLVFFDTNGEGTDFVVELNPGDNPNLRPLVQNFLAYVTSGRYDGMVVNRAARDFVVQLGGFRTDSRDVASVPSTGFPIVPTFSPVVTDADNNGRIDYEFSGNQRGTIALGLRAAPNGMMQPNSGQSSFYVNLGDHSFLDTQGFVPFARLVDMTPIDRINALQRVDLSVRFGQTGSLAYVDTPTVDAGQTLLVIERAFLIPEPTCALLLAWGLAAAPRRRG